VGIVVDKVALGQVFSEYFGFPCQSSFHQLHHNHPHLSSGAGTISQKYPQYKGLSPTPLAITKIIDPCIVMWDIYGNKYFIQILSFGFATISETCQYSHCDLLYILVRRKPYCSDVIYVTQALHDKILLTISSGIERIH
jgi:hypothetical protein